MVTYFGHGRDALAAFEVTFCHLIAQRLLQLRREGYVGADMADGVVRSGGHSAVRVSIEQVILYGVACWREGRFDR